MRRNRTSGGFTLIELLIVVAIIGILAAIAIPNLLLAITRAKQKRTVSDIRSIATAWESFAIEANSYTASAATFAWPAATVSSTQMDILLTPAYIKNLPDSDGWGTPFGYASDQPVGSKGLVYAIRAAGMDKQFDGDSYTTGMVEAFECDIVFANGSFVAFPQSAMKN